MGEAGPAAAAGADRQSISKGESAGRSTAGSVSAQANGNLPALMMIVGGLLTGITAGAGTLALSAGRGDGAELRSVATDQLEAAIGSMGSRPPTVAVEEARQCKSPFAVLTVSADGSAGAIRIRSGSYLSPAIQLSPSAQRIAIPFPAAYATGKGVLSVEGLGQGVNVWLSPGRHYTKLEGAEAINVWWTPKSPC